MAEKQQRLVLSIIDFLNQSVEDGTVKADDKESLEVASASIALAVPNISHFKIYSSVHRRGVRRGSFR